MSVVASIHPSCVGRYVGLALFVALSGCSMPEEPITPNPDTTPDEVAEGADTTAVCPSWHTWDLLTLEVVEGPPIAIDAVVLTNPCNGRRYVADNITHWSRLSGEMGDWELEIEAILRAPDATPEHSLGTTVSMTKGDLITVQLVEFGPRDLVEVFAVEPVSSSDRDEPIEVVHYAIRSQREGFHRTGNDRHVA